MVRVMYDAVVAADVPADGWAVAGYVNGKWPDFGALEARFPAAQHVSITVNDQGTATVLDVESGDATPAEAPAWAARQRAGGNPYPVVYMDESAWSTVQAAFSDQGVAAPLYWVASYVDDPTKVPDLPDGAIALQFYDYGGYDASVAADYWPGLDPAPVATSTKDEDDDMTTTSVAGRAGLSWAAGSRHVVQVGYDPAGGNPTLRIVLVLTTGPLVVSDWTFTAGLGTGVYELPEAHIPACRGVILEWAADSEHVTYDVTAV